MGEPHKIIRKLNSRTFVIDAGKDKKLVPGELLEVLDFPELDFDPVAKNFLGTVRQFVRLAKVIDVAEKMAVCEAINRP
ncbi:MAG: hypothetical protein LBO03_04430 [Acidaminococcales bacterium]|jgi:hypothetical protein|nr:hypothetical protein [Acidaminococcales bacterium]